MVPYLVTASMRKTKSMDKLEVKGKNLGWDFNSTQEVAVRAKGTFPATKQNCPTQNWKLGQSYY